MALKYEDVFRPGSFPEYTYISRRSAISDLSYEFLLEQAIKVSGFLISLIGSSKMVKTILCEKVIGLEKIIPDTSDKYGNKEVYALTKDKIIGYFKSDQYGGLGSKGP